MILNFIFNTVCSMYRVSATESCVLFENGKKPMIICQCNGVTDRTIRKAVRDGANDRNEVIRNCTAGKACGGCVPAIDEILEAEQERIARSGLTVLKLVTG